MTNEPSGGNKHEPTLSLEQVIGTLLTDLFYPSESDEPVEFVNCYLKQEEPFTVNQIEAWLMLPPSTHVEEIPEADFWEPVTTYEDWYSEEEQQRTDTFVALKKILNERLTVRQVFRVGDTEVDIYLLGRTDEGTRAGLKTKVIET